MLALFAFTVPLSVAPVVVTELTTEVVTAGAAAVVVNVRSVPLVVQAEFTTFTLKW